LSFLFIREHEVLEIHAQLIETFGGVLGLRDEAALQSALAAAENREYYEGAALFVCAATYAYHLTQAHAFIDGNKRIGAAVSEIFLELNGSRLNADNEQIVSLFLDLAASERAREDVEEFFNRGTALAAHREVNTEYSTTD
jgi:death-on-curing protein